MKEADVELPPRLGRNLVVLVAAFFNIATRVADALGIEFTPTHACGTSAYEHS
jgi:hypothetical protein